MLRKNLYKHTWKEKSLMTSVQNMVRLSSFLCWSFIYSFKISFISSFIEKKTYSIGVCINVFITLAHFILPQEDKLHKNTTTSY